MVELQSFDFISPSISLFFNSKRTHTSKISGLIVIILISICISYSCLLLYSIINHLNVISLIYKKFEWEAGFYSMNKTQLFHFFQIFSPEEGGYYDKYDSKYIRIYTSYVHNNLEQSKLHNYDHWVFEECREGIDNKELNEELFKNIVNFTNSACIRYYYNSQKDKYYAIEDEEFIWPHLEHGISRRDNVFLTTMVEKCTNNSVLNRLLGDCASTESIEKYIKKYFGFYMYLLDNSVDPNNYKNPIQSYFHVISTGIGNSQIFFENYLHFSPVRMRTKVGEIFGEYTDINSFFFDYNIKGAAESYNRILLKYYYLMQNNNNIYERRYNGIFDIFSNIGGTSQLLFYIFFVINYIYNKYIIIMDTNHFFCKIVRTSNESNSNDGKLNHKIINSFKNLKINLVGYEPKFKFLKKQIYSLNLNTHSPLNSKMNENINDSQEKNELGKNKTLNFSKFKANNQLNKNIILKSSKKKLNGKKEIKTYIDSSNLSINSIDNSIIKIKQTKEINKEKELGSIDLLKEKNLSFQNNKKKPYFSNYTFKNNHTLSKFYKSKKTNSPPRKSIFQFLKNFKRNNHHNHTIKDSNKFFSKTVKPSIKNSNLDEAIRSQKLNKEMVHKSEYFEKEFSFFYYLLCGCSRIKRKKEFKNLSALTSFRKKILSENFIFQQHIINLLLGIKCGINPQEIKYLI